ncbi:MAG: hypothetical protein FK732_06445, partial [Asgard group archaeon]|nr:hypothetical protein [Asgard group archaeon]
MKIRGKKAIVIVLILCVSLVSFQKNTYETDSQEPFFTLVATAETVKEGESLWLIKQYLKQIHINLDIITMGPFISIIELIVFHDYDLLYRRGGFKTDQYYGVDPFGYDLYNENATLNAFGYHTYMDYEENLGTGRNEWYIKEGSEMIPSNSQDNLELSWEWQYYLMHEILPCLPMFAKWQYAVSWENLRGFNYSKGLLQSWGKMYYYGTHTGQENNDEVVISDSQWNSLNPLDNKDTSKASQAGNFIANVIMDPLIRIDSDKSIWPHLATNWEKLANNQIRFSLRENIRWQDDPEGNFTNEYFDAQDVFFSIYCYKMLGELEWISDFEI